MRKWILIGLYLFMFGAKCYAENYPLWLVKKSTIKPETATEYIQYKNSWFKAYSQFVSGKNSPPIYGYEDLDTPTFIYFCGLNSYADMDHFQKLKSDFTASMPSQLLENRENRLKRTYSVGYSLDRFVEECSHFPKNDNTHFSEYAYVTFLVYSVFPGMESTFEGNLENLKHKKEFENTFWQVWKGDIALNLPKYVICLFSHSLEDLEKKCENISFVDASVQRVVQKERRGTARFRPDLSYIKASDSSRKQAS